MGGRPRFGGGPPGLRGRKRRYRNVDPLKKAVNDARAVGGSLEQLGFKVTLGENLAWRDYIEKFSVFENAITPGDIVFVFYSGHGVEIDGANFLIPVDAPKVSPEQQSLLRDVSISTDNLIQRLKARGTRAQIIVLDACRDNPFRLATVDPLAARVDCGY